MSAFKNLLLDDEIRHPLIADNPDWENKIIPALVEMGHLQYSGALDLNTVGGARILRCLLETVYVMGHQAGGEQ